MKSGNLFSSADIAEATGRANPRVINRWIREGKLTPEMVGNVYVFTEAEYRKALRLGKTLKRGRPRKTN